MNSHSGEHAAQDRFNLTFAPGLVEALAQHIKSQHGQEISQHNGGAMDWTCLKTLHVAKWFRTFDECRI